MEPDRDGSDKILMPNIQCTGSILASFKKRATGKETVSFSFSCVLLLKTVLEFFPSRILLILSMKTQ